MTETNINAVHRDHIHEKCNGCGKVIKDSMCSAYPVPSALWRRGNCPLADHLEVEITKNGRVRVGQQKGTKKDKRG